MKRTLLGLFLLSVVSAKAETVVLTRVTTFPKFGTAKTVVSIERHGWYPNSKTLVENKSVVPTRYQIGFRQEDRYRAEPWDKYRMIMWR